MANNEIDPRCLKAFFENLLLSGVLASCPLTQEIVLETTKAFDNQPTEIENLIDFFQEQLKKNVWLMNPSTETLIMQTIELLRRKQNVYTRGMADGR